MDEDEIPVAIPALSFTGHLMSAQMHAQRALDLAYDREPQKFWTRIHLGRAQSILMSLVMRNIRDRAKRIQEQ